MRSSIWNKNKTELIEYAQTHTIKECAVRFGCTKGAMQTYLSKNKIKHLKESMSEKQKGNNNSYYKHGGRYTRLYRIWAHMKDRCNNPKHTHYNSYGGRGIKVCRDWLNFLSFQEWAMKNGYSDTLTLDRINNDKGYYPDNCHWTDKVTQQNNTRHNRLLTYKGQTKTIAQWARELHVNRSMLDSRLERGWSVDKTIGTPRR